MMLQLLHYFSFSFFKRRFLKVILTILGMSLGVAIFTAIYLSNEAVLKSFEYRYHEKSGLADGSITSQNNQLKDSDYLHLLSFEEVESATPQLEFSASCANDPKKSFQMIGIDPVTRSTFFGKNSTNSSSLSSDTFLQLISRKNTVLISDSLRTLCGIRKDEQASFLIDNRLVSLEPLISEGALFQTIPFTAIVDISTAQELLNTDQLTQIDLKFKNNFQTLSEKNIQSLRPGISYIPRDKQLSEERELLKSFQVNLQALSFISIFTAIFIVFYSSSLSIVYRRSDFGMLRALGIRRKELASLFFYEIILCGMVSTLLGIFLGWFIARLIFENILNTVRDLYLVQIVSELSLSKKGIALAAGVGLCGSFFGALIPLVEILKVNPIEAIRKAVVEKYLQKKYLLALSISFILFIFAIFTFRAGSTEHPFFGFATTLFALLGFLALTPIILQIVLFFSQAIAKKLKIGSLYLASIQILQNPYRYSIVIASLVLGITLWLGISLMIFSFRDTVQNWVNSSIRGDIYLSFKDNPQNNYQNFIPEDLIHSIRSMPGIQFLDSLRTIKVQKEKESILLSSVELNSLMQRGSLQILQGERSSFSDSQILKKSAIPTAISESLARRFNLKRKDVYEVRSDWGVWKFEVTAILYDYTSEKGLIYLNRSDFQSLTKDFRLNSLALYLEKTTSLESILSILQTYSLPHSLEIRPNQELKKRIFQVFDQTFEVTEAMKQVCFLVSFLGILTALITLTEEKRREIGLIQALGIAPGQLLRYGFFQALLFSLAGYLLGLFSGIALAWIILHQIHRDFFGWSLNLKLNFHLIWMSFFVTLMMGGLASLWSILFLRKLKPIEALQFDE